MLKKFFKRSRNESTRLPLTRVDTQVTMPDDIELLAGKSCYWQERSVSKFRHFASDGRVCLSLEQTGTGLLLATAWLSRVDLVPNPVDPASPKIQFSEEFLGKDLREQPTNAGVECHTHPQFQLIDSSGEGLGSQFIEPGAPYGFREGSAVYVQSVTKDYSLALQASPELVLRGRVQAMEMAEVVRDLSDRCSCTPVYDVPPDRILHFFKSEDMEWKTLWVDETSCISRDGDVLLALDRTIDGSAIVSVGWQSCCCKYGYALDLGHTSCTFTQLVDRAFQGSMGLKCPGCGKSPRFDTH